MRMQSLIGGLLLVNMCLFFVLFTLMLHTEEAELALQARLCQRHPDATDAALEEMARHLLQVYTWVGCAVVLVWALGTGFVVGLYRAGFWS